MTIGILLVDPQYDFFPGGSLAVGGATAGASIATSADVAAGVRRIRPSADITSQPKTPAAATMATPTRTRRSITEPCVPTARGT